MNLTSFLFLTLLARLGWCEYRKGDILPLECIARDIDVGEHKSNANGTFQFQPFPSCLETNRPLEIRYLMDEEKNCSIILFDELFHLMQLYAHLDAPWSCRFKGQADPATGEFAPIAVNMGGIVEKSHMDLRPRMNSISHAVGSNIDSGVAYSIGGSRNATRVVIGDVLPLQITIRWFPVVLPITSRQVNLYKMFGVVVLCSSVSFTLAVLYFYGVQLPQRIKWERATFDPGTMKRD